MFIFGGQKSRLLREAMFSPMGRSQGTLEINFDAPVRGTILGSRVARTQHMQVNAARMLTKVAKCHLPKAARCVARPQEASRRAVKLYLPFSFLLLSLFRSYTPFVSDDSRTRIFQFALF